MTEEIKPISDEEFQKQLKLAECLEMFAANLRSGVYRNAQCEIMRPSIDAPPSLVGGQFWRNSHPSGTTVINIVLNDANQPWFEKSEMQSLDDVQRNHDEQQRTFQTEPH